MGTAESQLFTLRIWQEMLGDGRTEWRGMVQHVLTGQVHYFRTWEMLGDRLAVMLSPPETPALEPSGPAKSPEGEK